MKTRLQNQNFQIFQIALNRVLTLPDYRSRLALLISCGIIDSKRKRAFRRALGKFYLRVASFLSFVVVLWVACCVHGVTKWGQKSDRIGPKSVEHRSKIGWKSVQNRWKFYKNREKSVKISFGGSFGTGSLPGRSQDGRRSSVHFVFWAIFAKKSKVEVHFGTPRIPTGGP